MSEPASEPGGTSERGGTSEPEGWEIRRSRGSAGGFHARDLTQPARRAVWIHEVDGPALVLGSTQRQEIVDGEAAARAGVEVVRRRSGGGAVLVEPGGVVWVDLIVPAGDPLGDDDVSRAAQWVGEEWAGALASLGVSGEVHQGGLETTPWSRLVCFAGRGPGEVVVGGRKVVGVAQRRTRAGARFQCAALLRWEPAILVDLLALVEADRRAAVADLTFAAAPLAVDAPALVTALLDRITAQPLTT